MMRAVRRTLTALVSSLALATGITLAVSTPAYADAEGCQAYSALSIPGIKYVVPRGILCHEINGDGHVIKDQEAIDYTVNTCNWRIDFVYIDTNRVEWYRDRGATHYSCSIPYRTRGNGWARYGKACANLYSNGVFVTKQCHSITS